MTHAELVVLAERWLKNAGCGVVFAELKACVPSGEIADAVGWKDGGATSMLIECKTSRSDFRADAKKAARKPGTPALGRWRYYLTPRGLLKPEELPPRWGLLETDGARVYVVRGWSPKEGRKGRQAWKHVACEESERGLLYSALRRIYLRGLLPTIYDPPP